MAGVLLAGSLVALAGVLSACSSGSSGGVQAETVASTSPTVASATSPAVAAAAQPGLDAYRYYLDAKAVALRHPWKTGDTFPSAANFLQYSFDPIRQQELSYVNQIASIGSVFTGTFPASHVRVVTVALDAKPYPTVTLADCQDAGTWRPVYADDHSPVPTYTPDGAKAPAPYAETITMIYHQKHWGVYKDDLDTSRTCSSPGA